MVLAEGADPRPARRSVSRQRGSGDRARSAHRRVRAHPSHAAHLHGDALLPPTESVIVDDFILEPEEDGTILRLLGSGYPATVDGRALHAGCAPDGSKRWRA